MSFSWVESNEWYYDGSVVLPVLEELVPPTSTILHAGCGTSKIGLQLQECGHTVINVDYSVTALREMQKLYPDADFRCEDCRNLKTVGDDTVDIVLDKGTFDSMTANSATRAENAHRLAEEFRRVLRPGGRILIFSSFGPEAEKDMMTILRVEDVDVHCRVLEFAPHEYPDDDHTYLYTLTKASIVGAEDARAPRESAPGERAATIQE